jgi:hypothetical protein
VSIFLTAALGQRPSALVGKPTGTPHDAAIGPGARRFRRGIQAPHSELHVRYNSHSAKLTHEYIGEENTTFPAFSRRDEADVSFFKKKIDQVLFTKKI